MIIAGFMISLGGYLYLTLGGLVGALFFSIGLLTILHFNFQLFTGKAGLLSTKQISCLRLVAIWIGNLIGASAGAVLASLTPKGQALAV